MILRIPLALSLLLTLTSVFAFNRNGSNRHHLNRHLRRRSPPPPLDRSLSAPPSFLPPSSSPPSSSGLQRSSSSPASLSSEPSFKSALDRSERSAPETPSVGSESPGRFGPSEYASPSFSDLSGSDRVRWADTPEREFGDRLTTQPEQRKVFDGVSNIIDHTLNRNADIPQILIDPANKLTHPAGFALRYNQPVLSSVPLPDGGFDKQFSSLANARIKAAISALPRGRFVLVSLDDPSAPGGIQIYKYFSDMHRERIHYAPPLLHQVKAMEENIRTADLEPEVEERRLNQIGWKWQARPHLPPEFYNYPPPPAPPTGWKAVQEKVREGMMDVKDSISHLTKSSLNPYHTTNGIPAIWGREEMGIGKTIPPEAREVAKKFGEVRVFFDPNNPKDQLRMVYTGSAAEKKLGEDFKTFLVPESKALPLPKEWRGEGVKATLKRMRMADKERFYDGRPRRWEVKAKDGVKSLTSTKDWERRIKTVKSWKRVQRVVDRMRSGVTERMQAMMGRIRGSLKVGVRRAGDQVNPSSARGDQYNQVRTEAHVGSRGFNRALGKISGLNNVLRRMRR